MDKSVSRGRAAAWAEPTTSLYALNGERKYLNGDERMRVLKATKRLSPDKSIYARLLAWTGVRPSELLNVSASSIDIEGGVMNVVTLKRRKFSVRGVPIPPALMIELVRHFDLRRLQADAAVARQPLFAWSRITAWRIIKAVMGWAGIGGIKACPKGLRHAFGVGCLTSGVPITLVQRWLGHARLSTTAIYLNVSGPEEIVFARRFWNGTSSPVAPEVARHCAGLR